MIEKDDKMNEDNVEEFVNEAINTYFEKHLTQDALFWRTALVFLKKEMEQKTKFHQKVKIGVKK